MKRLHRLARGGHVTRLNFVPAGAPPGGWRLALLALGVLALLPAAASWTAQLQAVRRLEAQLTQAQPRRLTRPALAPTAQRELDQQVKAVAEAVRLLNLPVARLIKTVQAPADVHVALLGLDLNGQAAADAEATGAGAGAATATNAATPSGGLKIAAEAETVQDMINYLAFLNQQPIFKSVYLVKHEMHADSNANSNANANAPNHPYRFQMEAQWRL